MTLFAEILETLSQHGLPCALIGAAAMAAHGVARATMDIDLLLVGREALDSPAWEELRRVGVSVEVRRGGGDDPLEGVVHLRRGVDAPIDIIIGSAAWQRQVVERVISVEMLGAKTPVATARDLILLKLYAGAPQDLWDITRLLATSRDPDLRRSVEAELSALPRGFRELWRSIPGSATA